jgi:hypothetical protein
MLRFLTDEDFDGRLTSALLARVPGFDLVRAQDTGLTHTPDPDILAWAAGEGRIVLTHDRNTMTGFASTRASAGQPMPGLFVVDRQDKGAGMQSPFAGMDPYIEACGLWEGFHNRLIHKVDETLARVLPRGYTIDTVVRSYIVLMESEGKREHLAKPDVALTHGTAPKKPRKKKGAADLEPGETGGSVLMQAFVAEKFEETFVEIYAEREERRLVTCLEVLSPANKRPNTEGWRQYERKRQAMLLGQANFIEIDLLRGGHKMPMLTAWPDSPFTLLVCRQTEAPYCRVWPVHLRRCLPAIPVPLKSSDPDLSLDLQPLLDGIYALGRYDERIDYTRPLDPALSDVDAAWLRDLQRKERAKR